MFSVKRRKYREYLKLLGFWCVGAVSWNACADGQDSQSQPQNAARDAPQKCRQVSQTQLRDAVREAIHRPSAAIQPTVFRPDSDTGILHYTAGSFMRVTPTEKIPFGYAVAAQTRVELLRKALSGREKNAYWEARLRRPEQLIGKILGDIASNRFDNDALMHNAAAIDTHVGELLDDAAKEYAATKHLTLSRSMARRMPREVKIQTVPPGLQVAYISEFDYQVATKLGRPLQWQHIGVPMPEGKYPLLGRYRFQIGGREIDGVVDTERLQKNEQGEFFLILRRPE